MLFFISLSILLFCWILILRGSRWQIRHLHSEPTSCKNENHTKENEVYSSMKCDSQQLYFKLYFLICYAHMRKDWVFSISGEESRAFQLLVLVIFAFVKARTKLNTMEFNKTQILISMTKHHRLQNCKITHYLIMCINFLVLLQNFLIFVLDFGTG